MPDFVNPFSGKVPDRMLTHEELVRAIRLNLAAEEEATHLYMAHAEATDNAIAKAVLMDIANEERVHKGEFHHLLQLLTGDEDAKMAEGAAEVDALAAGVAAGGAAAAPADGGGAAADGPTIGSLRG
jgi:uncharacterized protein